MSPTSLSGHTRRAMYPPDSQGKRYCSKCHGWWPADREHFHLNAGGLSRMCRNCTRLRNRKASGKYKVPSRSSIAFG